MELTRVTDSRGEQGAKVAAAGGDADLLALLLGGDQDPSSAFPATLQAALASGDAEEPLAVGDGADDAALAPDDGTAASVDAALAAAIALAAAVVAAATTDATPGADAAGGEVGSATGLEVTVTPGDTAVADAANTTAVATTDAGAFPVAAEPQAPINGTAAAAAATAAEAAAAAAEPAVTAASPERPVPAATASDAAATSVPTNANTSADVASKAAPRELASAGDQTATVREQGDQSGEHGAGSGLDADEAPSFAHDEGERRGLDLGTSERHLALPAVEAPAPAPVTATSAGAPGDAVHVSRAEPDAGTAGQISTTTAAPVTTQEATTVRGERPAPHPGAIEARWGERVSDAVRLSSLRGGGEIRLQLEPEGLGHIDVRLHLHSDGVRAVIVAEHESTRALLASQQHVLQDAFDRSDLRLSGFSVDVGADGRAASFATADERGQGNGPDGGSTGAAPRATTSAETHEATGEPTANGRVNVRV